MRKQNAITRKTGLKSGLLQSLVFGVFMCVWTYLCIVSAYADIDNTAQAKGTYAGNEEVSNTDTVSVPLTAAVKTVAITKSVLSIIDTNTNGVQDAGDTVNYTLSVTNTGNVTLTNVTVMDAFAVVTGAPFTLDPGQTNNTAYTASYVLVQADFNAGQFNNQASVVATPPLGPANSVTDLSHPTSLTADAVTTVTLTQPSSISIDKVATLVDVNTNGVTDLGDRIDYAFTITNTGFATLSTVTVTDTVPGVTLLGAPIGTLLPGQSNNTAYTASILLTQAIIDAGQFVNTADVAATTPSNTTVNASDTETSSLPRSPAITVVKSATPNFGGNGQPDVGDTINYQFTVVNAGNVTLTNVSVTDSGAIVSGGPISSLAPGNSDNTTFSAVHTLTQADINAGTYQNQATATGTSPTGNVSDLSDNNNPAENDPTIVSLPQNASIALVKTVGTPTDTNGNGTVDAGDVINYDFAVTNTGNVTLSNITIADLNAAVTGGPLTALTPGSTDATTFDASHVITIGDMNAGSFQNSATVTGTPPVGANVSDVSDDADNSGSDPTVVSLLPTPGIALLKTIVEIEDTNGNAIQDAGDTIKYDFTVRNTGNVTLTNVIVTDANPSVTLTGGPIVSLAPGVSDATTYEASHVLTQADMDAGQFDNQASVVGTPPSGPNVTDNSHPTGLTSDGVTTATLTPVSSMSVVKAVVGIFDSSNNPVTTVLAGHRVDYSFLITNTGTTTLSNVAVTDPGVTLTGSPITTLLPGASDSTTYAASYVLTQADINAGQYINNASVAGTNPQNANITASDSETVTYATTSSIALVKTGTLNLGSNGQVDANDTITYQFSVTNTGTTTLTNVTIADPLVTVTGGPIATLLPGATDNSTFAATYTLTQANVDAGQLQNQATANATGPQGPVTDQSDDTSTAENDPTVISYPRTPGIALVKAVSGLTDPNANGPDAGDVISYTLSVTNTGNVTLNNVVVTDPSATLVGTPIATLQPGQTNTTSYSATHTITLADMNTGSFQNQATVTAQTPLSTTVSDLSDETDTTGNDPTVVSLTPQPSVALLKTVSAVNDTNANGRQDAGDTVTYAFTVRNTGNVTLTNVTVTDPVAVLTGAPIALLAPGAVNTTAYTASHVLTQADMDAGFFDNQASVVGTPPSGPADNVTDASHPTGLTSDGPTRATLAPQSSIAFAKSITGFTDLNGNSVTDAGDRVNYAFAITNTGTTTLSNVTVTDPGVTLTGAPIASLAPGVSNTTTYAATRTLTQADIDAGQYANTATVTATRPISGTVSATDSKTATYTTTAGISVLKSATPNYGTNGTADVGDTITYNFTVTNTGITTLTNVTLTDPIVTVSGGPIVSLLPGVSNSTTFSAVKTLTQADLDAGRVQNQATARATSPRGPVSDLSDPTSPTDSAPTIVSYPTNPNVALVLSVATVQDTNGNGIKDAGDTIIYTVTATNTGNVTLNNVIVTNPMVNLTGSPIAVLAPGQSNSTAYSASYVITAADVVTGQVATQAAIIATTPTGTTINDISDESDVAGNDPTIVPVPAIGITLNKTSTVFDANSNGRTDVNDVINYAFVITNTGAVTLSNITINDPTTTVVGGPLTLAAGATNGTHFVASHTLTQADINAGRVTNTATVIANTPDNATIRASDTENTTFTVVSSLSLDKAGTLVTGGDGIANPGDVINYTFTVTNTGATTLTNVRIDDPLLTAGRIVGDPDALTMLAAAQSADPITTATVAKAEPKLPPTLLNSMQLPAYVPPNHVMVAPLQGLSVSIHAERDAVLMTGNANAPQPGDELGILFRLTNSGDVPLTSLRVAQEGTQLFSNSLDILAPNTTDVGAILLIHKLTAEEIVAGKVATPAAVFANARGQVQELRVEAPIELAELETVDEIATATITPSNTPSLAPGQNFVFTANHVLTQANIDAGVVNNTATALGNTPSGGEASSTDRETVPVPAVPGIAVVKTSQINMGTDGIANVGDTITYRFAVTNTGNVSLNNITITDTKVPTVNGTLASLAPGVTNTTAFTATYTITAADMDLGNVQNQATVTGRPAVGPAVTDLSDDNATTGNDPTITNLPQQPAITLVKQASPIQDTNNNGVTDVGDTINYNFTVRNSGNVTLTNVTITDTVVPAIGGPITLAPGASDNTSFTASLVLTQVLIDAGTVSNQALATGTPPLGLAVTDQSHPTNPALAAPTIVTIPQSPGIALVKTIPSVTDVNGNALNDLGDIVNYRFSITNTGNVTLNNVTLTDNNAVVLGTPITLLPGQVDNTTLTATHVIVQADVIEGQVTNQAIVNARTTAGAILSDASDNADIGQDNPTILAVATSPAITVIKTVQSVNDTNTSTIIDAGDVITYAFTIKNTGNTRVNNITLTELLPGATVIGGPLLTLLPGATDTTTFTATYTVLPQNVADGFVSNQVRVQGLASGNRVVTDLSDDADETQNDPTITTINNAPAVALVKTISGVTDTNNNGLQDAGDVINYAFNISNTGNVPLLGATIIDNNAVVSGAPISSLAVGASDATRFTATHVITQADMDAGGIENQADVRATSTVSSGTIIDKSDDASPTENDPTFMAIVQTPRIAVVKRVASVTDRNGNGIHDVGDIINYAFTVTNTGNVTLDNVTVTDLRATMSGGPISLTPGQANGTNFTATHQITIPEGEAGRFENQATARGVGRDTANTVVTDLSDESSISGNDPTVILVTLTPPDLTKTAARSQVARGEIVPYTIRATNVQANTFFVRDIMPPGFQFVAGSATSNGVVVTPAVSGSTLTFTGLTHVNNAIEIKLKLTAGVTLKTGKFVNKAEIIDLNSGNVAARAQATVTVQEEHVFDCSDIIGRVFDDLNSNGYADNGEPGVAGVRIVTVNGRIITTDENGRFSVPCAAMPDASIGSNYILKLDPKSLPAGYSLTTENPRTVRVTPGKVVKLNFGVSGTRDITVDVKKDAFTDGIDLKPNWASGLDRLVQILIENRGRVSVVYRCGVYAPIADERLEHVQNEIAKRWKAAGAPYRLNINARVECGK